MSRAAGTLITTNNATFIPPRFMPGYQGHCPTTKYDYGETYGEATSKYFQDYRSRVLSASADPYCRGGDFPTYYTHRPETVISNRTRTRDRWLHTPKYSLTNVDFDRKEELKSYDKLAQKHREYYNDKTGTVKRTAHFMLPNNAEDQLRRNVKFFYAGFNKFMIAVFDVVNGIVETSQCVIMSTRHSDNINLPFINHEARRSPLLRRVAENSSQRDREMRDVYFESR